MDMALQRRCRTTGQGARRPLQDGARLPPRCRAAGSKPSWARFNSPHGIPRVVACRLSPKDTGVVLVGDIGGTNARLSVWKSDGTHAAGEVFAKTFPTANYKTFDDVMDAFLGEAAAAGAPPGAAALAIAGAVEDNKCAMTNLDWLVDGDEMTERFGIRVQLLNDFEAVGYGIPALQSTDMVCLNDKPIKPKAPKVVMGPGTGLGAAQLMWDSGAQAYKVWPGEGSHATFAPRGWKQQALAAYAAAKFGGHVEVEQVACGSGLQLVYEFLLTDEPGNRQNTPLGSSLHKTAAQITTAALKENDVVATEAVDIMMNIVGAEAGAMALRSLAHGGVYIAGGITPKLLPHLRKTPSGGGALLEGFLCRAARPKFRDILASMPLFVITNEKVGQIGAREVALKLLRAP